MNAVVECELEEFYVDAVTEGESNQKEWIVHLQINDRTVACKLDTGAQVNIMSEMDFNKLKPRPKLHSAKVKVTGYSGIDIPVKGKCVVKVQYKEKTYHLWWCRRMFQHF